MFRLLLASICTPPFSRISPSWFTWTGRLVNSSKSNAILSRISRKLLVHVVARSHLNLVSFTRPSRPFFGGPAVAKLGRCRRHKGPNCNPPQPASSAFPSVPITPITDVALLPFDFLASYAPRVREKERKRGKKRGGERGMEGEEGAVKRFWRPMNRNYLPGRTWLVQIPEVLGCSRATTCVCDDRIAVDRRNGTMLAGKRPYDIYEMNFLLSSRSAPQRNARPGLLERYRCMKLL